MSSSEIMLFAAIALVGLVVLGEFGGVKKRLTAIEGKIDAVRVHLGLAVRPAISDEVTRLARQGHKIEAIRAYREATGAGLAAAKEAVEQIAAGASESAPHGS